MEKLYLLVDSRETLDAFVKEGLLSGPEATVVACQRKGAIACALHGIEYRMLEDFAEPDALIELTLNNYGKLVRLCEALDALALNQVPDLKERGIKPFAFSYYYLKMLSDTLFTKAYYLTKLLGNIPESRVAYRKVDIHEDCTDSITFSNALSLASPILEELARSGIYKGRLLPVLIPGESTGDHMRTGSLLYAKRRWNRLKQSVARKLHRGKQTYLLFSAGYDVSLVIPLLKERGMYPETLQETSEISRNKSLEQQCEGLWVELQGNENLRSFFRIGGVNLFALAAPKIQLLVTKLLPNAVQAYDACKNYLTRHKRERAFALTDSVLGGLRIRSQMKAAQNQGLPLVSYQEGAGYGSMDLPMYDYVEVNDGEVFLCYGMGNVEHYSNRNIPVKRFVPVGSAAQDLVGNRRRHANENCGRRIQRIMYVGTVIVENEFHSPNIGLSACRYFKSQLRIFEHLASLSEDVEVAIKLHPQDRETRAYLEQDLRFGRFELRDGPFQECMDDVDLLLIDFPSTTLLYGCQTDAEIFVLTEKGISGLHPENLESLQKRAYCFSEFSSFREAVSSIVTNRSLYPPRRSDEFLRMYGTYLGDGQSALRAAEFLASLSSYNA